jgi:hypothetical protein
MRKSASKQPILLVGQSLENMKELRVEVVLATLVWSIVICVLYNQFGLYQEAAAWAVCMPMLKENIKVRAKVKARKTAVGDMQNAEALEKSFMPNSLAFFTHLIREYMWILHRLDLQMAKTKICHI